MQNRTKIDLQRRSEIGKERRVRRLADVLERVVSYLSNTTLEQASIEEIAAASGIARSTFYNYFKKKTDVVVAVETLLFNISRAANNRTLPQGSNVVEAIAFGFLANLKFGSQFPSVTSVSFNLYLSSYPHFSGRWMDTYGQYEKLYQKGVSQGVFLDMESELQREFITTPLYCLTNRIANVPQNESIILMKSGVCHALLTLGVDREKATKSVDAMMSCLPETDRDLVRTAYSRTAAHLLSLAGTVMLNGRETAGKGT